MDLYLMSPVFLRKMIKRSSAITSPDVSDIKDLDLDEDLPVREESQNENDESESEVQKATYYRDGRRRSSLDRMLRQHAYIIICMLYYACTIPGTGT